MRVGRQKEEAAEDFLSPSDALRYEVEQFHRQLGGHKTPAHWPTDSTICEAPNAHRLKEHGVKLDGVGYTATVCTLCDLALLRVAG